MSTPHSSLSSQALQNLERILLAPAEDFPSLWEEAVQAGHSVEIAQALAGFYRLHLMLQTADGPDEYEDVVRKVLHDSA